MALQHARNALVFGDEVAGRYAGMDPAGGSRERLDRLAATDADVARVRGYATMVYTQVASGLHGLLTPGYTKHHTLIAARTPQRQRAAKQPACAGVG